MVYFHNDTLTCIKYFDQVVNPAYLAVTMPQLFSPVVCLFLVVAFALRFFGRGCFHVNAKILVACQLIFTTIYCCVFVFTHGQLSINLIFEADRPCSVVHYAYECVVLFWAIIASVTGMAATQVCIGVERLVSSVYITSYERFGAGLGLLLAVCAVLLSGGVCLIVLSEYNPLEIRLTCMGVPASAGDKARILYYVIIGCDTVTMVLFIITWKVNTRLNLNSDHDPLPVKYQKKENANVIRMFLPNVIAHCLVYCIFSVSAIIIRANRAAIEAVNPLIYTVAANVPHYTAIEMLVLHAILTRQLRQAKLFQEKIANRRQDLEKEVYFENYTKQWG